MAKKYLINGEFFPTQKDLVNKVREIIAHHENGESLNMFDFPFVLSLLERHPDADLKIGCGVASIYVADNPVFPGKRSRGFRLCREDGSETDFSFWECIRSTPHRKNVCSSMRVVVEADTIAFKQSAFDCADNGVLICPDSAEEITFLTAHVDHKEPKSFMALVASFLESEGLKFDDIAVEPTSDNKYQDKLVDVTLAERWRAFHRENADLEVVSKKANLSIRKKQQDAP